MPALDPKLDIVFTMLFGGRAASGALESMVAALLDLPTPVPVTVSESGQDPESPRDLVLDARVELPAGDINVELRCTRRHGFRNRALYEWGQLFARKFSRGNGGLVPLCPIVFTTQREIEVPRLHHVFRFLEIHDDTRLSDAFEMHLVELPKLADEDAAGRARPAVLKWARFLAASTDDERREAAAGEPPITAALDALLALSQDDVARRMARQREMELKAHDFELAEARQEAWEEGELKGRAAAVLQVLAARGFDVGPALRDRVFACKDKGKLDRMLQQALVLQPADGPFAP